MAGVGNPKVGNWGNLALAWEYLLPQRRMTRCVDTLEVHSARWGMHRLEVDVSYPQSCAPKEPCTDEGVVQCLIPIAFIPKEPVAADLEVQDATGALVSVPTKTECMALTQCAFSCISQQAGALLQESGDTYSLDSALKQRIGDLIVGAPLHARVTRLEISKNLVPEDAEQKRDWLLPLLHRLEDNYLLWVPITGPPLSEKHLSVRRSDTRVLDPIFPQARRKDIEITVHSEAGDITGHWNPPRKWIRRIDVSAAAGRLLVTFGLMPVKFEDEALESGRFSSYHLCMVPPSGLLIREVKAGGIPEAKWDEPDPPIRELKTSVDRTVRGEDTQTGHVHLAMTSNPTRLNSRVTIGLRPGTTTLWALVAVLTAGLLWSFHHELQHLLGSVHKSGHGHHHHHLLDLQIAVGVLLVGPTFAASWTLREKDPTLLRSMLAGTRLLLLGSALLSVAAALALGGVRPFGWGRAEAIDWYASLSYTIAVLIVIGWLQARSMIWLLYRNVLKRTEWNLAATVLLALAAYMAIRKLSILPIGSTVVLFLTGFGFTAVAGNRTSVRLGQVSRLPAAVAGIAGILTLALASRELRLYNRIADKGFAHTWGSRAELAIAASALLLLLFRLIYEAGNADNQIEDSSKGQAPNPII